MENFFDNQRLVQMIWRRRIHFIIIGAIAILASAIFSGPMFITPKFKSTARVYPTNLWAHSNESETEQMIEVMNSDDIKFRMFESFNLDEVYGIHKDDPLYLTYMLDLYNTNVGIGKTEFETAEIKVLDEDPQRAADMCDSIIMFYSDKVREMQRIKDLEMVELANVQLEKNYDELAKVRYKLDSLRTNNGIINFETQVPEVTRGYMAALAAGRGNASDTKKIEKLYQNFSSSGTASTMFERQFSHTMAIIDSFTMIHDHYLAESEKVITFGHVVQKPFAADKKAYPIRWLIVLLSLLSALFLAVVTFMVIDYKKEA